jgi:hypothetical protein
MAVLAPGQVEYCTLKQGVTQDDFDNGTFVVAVTEATAVPRGINKELTINLDAAEVVQIDRKPTLDISCSVAQGWVAAAGEKHLVAAAHALLCLVVTACCNCCTLLMLSAAACHVVCMPHNRHGQIGGAQACYVVAASLAHHVFCVRAQPTPCWHHITRHAAISLQVNQASTQSVLPTSAPHACAK